MAAVRTAFRYLSPQPKPSVRNTRSTPVRKRRSSVQRRREPGALRMIPRTLRPIDMAVSVAPIGGAFYEVRNRITEFLIYGVILLFPFQVLAIPIDRSKIDLSNLLFLILIGWLATFAPGVRASNTFRIVLSGFVVIQIAIYSYSDVPLSRFLSAFTSIGSLMLFYGYRERVRYDVKVAYWLVLFSILCCAFASLFEFVVEGDPRPAGIMAEPSPAGMVVLAAVAGIAVSLRLIRNPVAAAIQVGLALVLMYIAFLLKTTHFVTLAITVSLVAVMLRALDIRTIALAAALLIAVYLLVSQDAHYLDRMDVGAIRITNISLLAWLQGFDQMIASLSLFPVVGAGLGGTGSFYFYSANSEALAYYFLADLNRFDAFSGFFRLIIELGPVFGGLALWALWRNLSQFARIVRRTPPGTNPQAVELVFLMTFAVALVLGTLLKEPVWTRSTVVVSGLLLFTLPTAALPFQRRRVSRTVNSATTSPAVASI